MSAETRRVLVDRSLLQGDDLFAVVEPLYWSVDIYNGPAEYERTLAQFSRAQRQLFAIHWYRCEVNNGGHDQFYFNSTGIVWRDALEGLRAAGLHAFAEVLLESANRLGGDPPLDREPRQDAMDEWEPSFDDLDRRFYRLEESSGLDEALLAFARTRPEAFYFDGLVRIPK